jgi:histidinol dehydrogenase
VPVEAFCPDRLKLDSSDLNFSSMLEERLLRNMIHEPAVVELVASIISEVRRNGDSALLAYTKQFDNFSASTVDKLRVSSSQMQQCLDDLDSIERAALEKAASRIRKYHERQKQISWQFAEDDGSYYGQKVTPLDRIGIYAPGGKANYPSSILMLGIPARVAGVKEIVATVPTEFGPGGRLVFAAAALAGVTELYTVGGAQAIASMAYGTQSIQKVDKIAGPGNVYVTVAKKLVFGEVGIDMVAGPSELTIICDGNTNPDWIAMDMFSQAEHDENAQSILISPDGDFLDRVAESINKLLPKMKRKNVITASLAGKGMLIKVPDLETAAIVSNDISPEHLELSVDNPQALLEKIRHAGAVFLGRYTPEALGDYCAGPSHVLPTSGTAKFFSALGVYDFQKRTSILSCSRAAALNLAPIAITLADSEGLEAHSLSAAYRLDSEAVE